MPIWLFFKQAAGTNVELSKLDFAYLGTPFVYVPAKASVNLVTLDFAYLGTPFVSYARG